MSLPDFSSEEKKDIYDKWEKLINMSEKELLAWAENDDRFLASLNRARAEEEGGAIGARGAVQAG